jgi:hypothetical protein
MQCGREPLSEVEALHQRVAESRVEREPGATGLAAEPCYLFEEAGAKPEATCLIEDDEVVDVDKAAADQILLDPVSGRSDHARAVPGSQETVARLLLAPHAAHELRRILKRWPELPQHREARGDVAVGLGVAQLRHRPEGAKGIDRSACIGLSPLAITLAEAGAATDREKCGLSRPCCTVAICAGSADLPNAHAAYFP